MRTRSSPASPTTTDATPDRRSQAVRPTLQAARDVEEPPRAARRLASERADARAPAASRPRRLLDQRRDAAGARAGRVAARDRRAPRRRAGGAARREPRARGGRGARVPEPLPDRRAGTATRWRTCSTPARASARGAGAPSAERILVEFVSANPTGPLHRGRGRHAAYGDSLARLLELRRARRRARVLRQRLRHPGRALGESIARAGARRGGARGRLPGRLRRASSRERIPGAADADLDELARRGVVIMVERIRASLDALPRRLRHLVLRAQRCTTGAVDERARAARSAAATSTATRAPIWLRTTDFGDDKDRVLRRSTASSPTSRRTSPTTRTSAARLRPAHRRAGAPTTTATCGA